MSSGGALYGVIGWTYIGVAVGWTLTLVCSMLFVWRHRHLPCIRIRRLPLLFTGICLLHAYSFVCGIAYVIGPVMPCTGMFWMMSIWVPCGVAVFQAANSQFFHIASRQKQYAQGGTPEPLCQEQARRLSRSRWRRIFGGVGMNDPNRIDRTLVYIGLGLIVELAVTLFIYFGSKKFHPSYGLWDWNVKGTVMEVKAQCARGWEWWPSIVWQFVWSWIYAPYMLWKTRDIRDSHGWRLQTICCCIAGLPGTPLWLAGLYAPQFAPVNKYFWPPTWLSLCILFTEIVTIGFPIVQIFKMKALRLETLEALASWEKRQQHVEPSESTNSVSEFSDKDKMKPTTTYSGMSSSFPTQSGKSSLDSQKSDMLTMAALENALRTNPVPLLQFAALKDFSGENVSFLMHVAVWRREWMSVKSSVAQHRQKQFIAATRLYAHFVSLEFSEFPINICSREMKVLHKIFEHAAAQLVRRNSISSNDSATPFDTDVTPSSSGSSMNEINLDALGRANLRSVSVIEGLRPEEELLDVIPPDQFSEMVFDNAEREIRYLILTNTWPKFVHSAYGAKDEEITLGDGKDERWVDKTKRALCLG